MKIREWRKKKGWSQQQLADAIGKTKACISQFEKGIRHPSGPTAAKLIRLSDNQITLSDIYGCNEPLYLDMESADQ
jgi:transcriptional regulator with XRE-family HTH domain